VGRLGYKVAIVTGGAEGLGADAAEALAADGATVLITGTRDDEGEAHAAAMRGRGLKLAYHHLDTGDAMGWAVLAEKIMRTHGHLDVLVNHASAYTSATIEDATAAQLRAILEADLIGPFLGTKSVIPAMRQSGGGAIINIAANPIVEILPLAVLYSAAKAALVNLTKSTASHCLQRGYDIRVNAVHPGTHETPALTAGAMRSTTAPRMHELLAALPPPAGQLYEFGAAIAYLAGDEAPHITGSELFCDGALAAMSFTNAAAPGG
jgi:3alpha(or 20beta)-hydroxysteroid dehydrogenase